MAEIIEPDVPASLDGARSHVKKHAYHMQQAIDENNVREALRCSNNMLSALRTSDLSPPDYYDLYMNTFHELSKLQIFFQEQISAGRPVEELYELVQHAAHIVPRMYLLVTVGSIYIKSKQAPSMTILKDLIEVVKGVQHPTRGLFLRTYLSQTTRNFLPDIGSEYETAGSSAEDGINFVLQNFSEMNRLWVRMQQQARPEQKTKMEKERQQLQDLIGRNLRFLSGMEAVDLSHYTEKVLPKVLEQIVNCRDPLAQHYLMTALIQAFPDDYHVATLSSLSKSMLELNENVNIAEVLKNLLERMVEYAASSPAVKQVYEDQSVFEALLNLINEAVSIYSELTAEACVGLFTALLQFNMSVFQENLDQADSILDSCSKTLNTKTIEHQTEVDQAIASLLSLPLTVFQDINTVLDLKNFAGVISYFSPAKAREFANKIATTMLTQEGVALRDPEKVAELFRFIQPIVAESETNDSEYYDEEEFEIEQSLIGRIIHLLYVPGEPDITFEIMGVIRKNLELGGPKRIIITLPPLVFSVLKLVRELHSGSFDCQITKEKVFKFLYKTLGALPRIDQYELALRLFLIAGLAANDTCNELVADEFFTQAFTLYEDGIVDSTKQVAALHVIIGALQRCTVFGKDARESLVHKAAQYSARLLKKPDQCRAVLSCAHLFWVEHESVSTKKDGDAEAADLQDGSSVALCMKRATKIADHALQMANVTSGNLSGMAELLIEILNKQTYFSAHGCSAITKQMMEDTVTKIKDVMQNEDGEKDGDDDAADSESAQALFSHALKKMEALEL